MAQFDVFTGASGKGYLLDCQSDLLSDLASRVVVPLLPMDGLPNATRLNPVLAIGDDMHVMSTQLLFAIPRSRLKGFVANIERERDVIMRAINLLWSGI